jgi:putative transcriptional regulator
MKKVKAKSSSRDIGNEIIAGLNEFADSLAAGRQITARTVAVIERPHDYSAQDVRDLRGKLNMSQAVFADLVCVSPRTIQSWEQSKCDVPPMAARLLDEIGAHMDQWKLRVHSTIKTE